MNFGNTHKTEGFKFDISNVFPGTHSLYCLLQKYCKGSKVVNLRLNSPPIKINSNIYIRTVNGKREFHKVKMYFWELNNGEIIVYTKTCDEQYIFNRDGTIDEFDYKIDYRDNLAVYIDNESVFIRTDDRRYSFDHPITIHEDKIKHSDLLIGKIDFVNESSRIQRSRNYLKEDYEMTKKCLINSNDLIDPSIEIYGNIDVKTNEWELSIYEDKYYCENIPTVN